jgi:putative peptidoglycan lipid II flippase
MKLNAIVKSVSYVTVGLILGKIAAFLKHAIVVKYAGINYDADVFFIANIIPETAINIILAGLLTGAFIPIAGEVLAKQNHAFFRRFISGSFYLLSFILLIIAGIIYIFSFQICTLIAPGFDLPQHAMMAKILQIFSPGIFFIGLAAILTGTMQTLGKFFVPSLGLFIANGTTIIFTILFFNRYGIYAVAAGNSIGFFLWFLSQVPFTFNYFLPKMKFNIKEFYIRKLAKFALPTISIILISNLVLIIEKSVASRFIEGTVTQLNLAFRLTIFFIAMFILPLGTVLLPKMSKEYGKSNIDKLYHLTKQTFLTVTLLLFAVLIFVLLNAKMLTYILYKPTGITNEAVTQIANYLRVYALAFLGQSYYTILLSLFFSTQRIKDLLKANLLGLTVYIAIVFTLYTSLNSYVLPLAYGFSYIIITIYLLWLVDKELFPNQGFILDNVSLLVGFIAVVVTTIFLYITRNINFPFYQELFISLIIILILFFILKNKIIINLSYLVDAETKTLPDVDINLGDGK